jgi:exonuclease III
VKSAHFIFDTFLSTPIIITISLNTGIFDELFLDKVKPDVVSIQEAKLGEDEANLHPNFSGYNLYYKPKNLNPRQGGGVALLIKNSIKHCKINDLDPSFEAVGVEIEIDARKLIVVSLYKPPNCVLPIEFITSLIGRVSYS